MSFAQWLREFKKLTGLKTAVGMTKILRIDYEDEYTPEQAAFLWSKAIRKKGAES